MKTALILLGLALLLCLVVIGLRPEEPVVVSVLETSQTSRGPSFEVHVERPRSALPLGGILPARLFGVQPLGFDHASPGAEVGAVRPDRLELRADGWDLSIETDDEGHVAPGTRLVFPLELAGKERRLRCRPADPATGYLRTTAQAGADELDGRFLVKLATCENVETDKTIEWPPQPLTLRGTFDRLPRGAG